MSIEYKVVPAPERARKKRGLKGAALFADALEEVMNELAADGWTYLRADTLPQEERSGLTGKTTKYRNLLVFQRVTSDAAAEDAAQESPLVLDRPQTPAPRPTEPEASTVSEPEAEPAAHRPSGIVQSRDPEDLIAELQGKRVDL